MMEAYLSSRATLRGVVLILDVRRVPSAEDGQMLSFLRTYGIQPVFVVTKCDKVSKNERKKQSQSIARTLQIDESQLVFFSALSREGLDAVWSAVEPLLALESV
jgi:GTP-binding protein